MRKELEKWVLDIAKYLATAVLISTIFRDIQEKSITFNRRIKCGNHIVGWCVLAKRAEKESIKPRGIVIWKQ